MPQPFATCGGPSRPTSVTALHDGKFSWPLATNHRRHQSRPASVETHCNQLLSRPTAVGHGRNPVQTATVVTFRAVGLARTVLTAKGDCKGRGRMQRETCGAHTLVFQSVNQVVLPINLSVRAVAQGRKTHRFSKGHWTILFFSFCKM